MTAPDDPRRPDTPDPSRPDTPDPRRPDTPGSQRPEPPVETFADELRDAIAPRTVLLVTGVGLLCLGFVLSYLGAFHNPKPHRIPVDVVAPQQVSARIVGGLNGIDGHPLRARAIADEATGRDRLTHAKTAAVLIVNPSGKQDRLLVASGGGATVVNAVQRIVPSAEATQGRSVAVTDAVPHQDGDGSTASVFYIAIGSVLAGYLLAALLGMAKGTRPATFRRTLWRLGATIPYSLVIGLGVAAITGPLLGALTGHFGAVFAISALLTLAAATVTMSFQILFGVVGIGVTILVFVIIGNPSAGGAYPYPLLAPFWRVVGRWLPNGAGVDALRRCVYFHAADIAPRVWVIVVWALAGTALTLVAAATRKHRASTP